MTSDHGITTTADDEQLHFILITTHHHNQEEWDVAIALATRFAVYVAIMALLVMIVALIVKLLGNCDGEDRRTETGRPPAATETDILLAKEAVPFTYGTCEGDLESGKCSNNTSEDLYDGKICVICYDQQRNCFFIPCGHCATCFVCAQRITEEESKTCPVCRRFIHKDTNEPLLLSLNCYMNLSR